MTSVPTSCTLASDDSDETANHTEETQLMTTFPLRIDYTINTDWLRRNGARVEDVARYAAALGAGLAQWLPNADISIDAIGLGEESEDMLEILNRGRESEAKLRSIIRQVASHALVAVLGPVTVRSSSLGVSETYRSTDSFVKSQAKYWKGAERLLIDGQGVLSDQNTTASTATN